MSYLAKSCFRTPFLGGESIDQLLPMRRKERGRGQEKKRDLLHTGRPHIDRSPLCMRTRGRVLDNCHNQIDALTAQKRPSGRAPLLRLSFLHWSLRHTRVKACKRPNLLKQERDERESDGILKSMLTHECDLEAASWGSPPSRFMVVSSGTISFDVVSREQKRTRPPSRSVTVIVSSVCLCLRHSMYFPPPLANGKFECST